MVMNLAFSSMLSISNYFFIGLNFIFIKTELENCITIIHYREVTIPAEWRGSHRVRIHFEAVDYHTIVYIDKGPFNNVDNS